MSSIVTMESRYNPYPLLLEEQLERLNPIIEKIQSLAEEKLSRIAIATAKHGLKEFKEQSYFKSALKILSLPIYTGLFFGIGGLTSYASLNLLFNGDFSDVFSSHVDLRVDAANKFTNAGALFVCVTDFPALMYLLYLFVAKKAYNEAVHEAWDKSYHACVNEDLSPEEHEELYQRHLLKLQSLGFDDFYLDPDCLSSTGAIYNELAPLLKKIDQEIKEGVSLRDLSKNCLHAFKQESCAKKLAKLTAGTVALGFIALSSFLMLENGVLIKDTPVGDLFSSDKSKQNDESFYLTQLGSLFSSFTACWASSYVLSRLFFQIPYKKTMREKINACFAKHSAGDLSVAMKNALYRIKEIKILIYGV